MIGIFSGFQYDCRCDYEEWVITGKQWSEVRQLLSNWYIEKFKTLMAEFELPKFELKVSAKAGICFHVLFDFFLNLLFLIAVACI